MTPTRATRDSQHRREATMNVLLVDDSKTMRNIQKKILAGLRGTGYAGQIVVLDYYSTDYSNSSTCGDQRLFSADVCRPRCPLR